MGVLGGRVSGDVDGISAATSIPLVLSQLAISVLSIFMAFSIFFAVDEYRNSVELGRKHISFMEAVTMSIKTMASPSRFFRFFGISILMSIAVVFGYVFFIIPGLILSASAVVLSFSMYERFRTEAMHKFVKTA